MEQISIKLRRAPDDLPAHNPEFQEELRAFAQSLRKAGLAYSQRGAVGYSLPEFFVTLFPAHGATFATILMTWLQNQSGRAIRVTLLDDEVDLQTVKDVEGFVEKLKLIQENTTPKGEGD
jgi:hypothetical protein